MNRHAFLVLAAVVILGGCASSPKLSQAQLNAIETREVDANLEQTFSAASNALFDAGYTIAMSDRAGGLLTGTRKDSKSSERMWVSPHIEDVDYAVSIQIRETDPSRCSVRVKSSVNGEPVVRKEMIDEIWVLMQRQVLMKEPPSAALN